MLVSDVKKVGILVFKVDYVLFELLWCYVCGGLLCEIIKVIFNYEILCEVVENFGILFEVVFVMKDNKCEVYVEIDELM